MDRASATGLCNAVFCAAPVIDPEDDVVIGLPDTVWFPEAALAALPEAVGITRVGPLVPCGTRNSDIALVAVAWSG